MTSFNGTSILLNRMPSTYSNWIFSRHTKKIFIQIVLTSILILLPQWQNVWAETDEPSITLSAMKILRDECISCHNTSKSKGGLNMESLQSLMRGSDSGTVVEPRQPAESYLLETLPADSDTHMPPKKQLSEAQISTLKHWIEKGMPWDAETLAMSPEVKPETWKLQPLPKRYTPVLAIAVSEKNSAIISSQGRELIVTRIAEDKPTQSKLSGLHNDAVRSLTVTPDQTQWVSGGFGHIHFWNIETGLLDHTISNPLIGRVTAMTYTMDGSKLIVGESIPGVSGIIHVFHESETFPEHSWQAHGDELTALQESYNGSFWMSGSADHTVRIWESDTFLEKDWLEGHTAPIMKLTQNTDGSLLISAGSDNALKVWDQLSRERLYDLGRHQFGLIDVFWKQDKSELFALNQRGTIYRYQDLKVHSGAQSSNTGRERVINRTKKPGSCLTYWKQHDLLVMGTFEGELHAFTSDGKAKWNTKPFESNQKPLASQ